MKAIAFGINVEAQKDEFWQATAGKGNFVSTLDTFAEVELTPNHSLRQGVQGPLLKSPTYNAGTYDCIMLLKT